VSTHDIIDIEIVVDLKDKNVLMVDDIIAYGGKGFLSASRSG